MKCGCVIVNFNDSSRVIKLCKLLVTYNVFNTIVIVDNKSKKMDYDCLKEFVEQNHDSILLTSLNENYGFNVAANVGMKYFCNHNYEYVCHINSDVYVDSDTIKKMINFLETQPDISVVSCRMLQQGEFKQMYYNFPTTKSLIFDNLGITKVFKIKPKIIFKTDEYLIVDFVRGSFCIMRCNDIFNAGLFNEDTFLYFGEASLAKKLLPRKEAVLINYSYVHNHPKSNRKSAIKALYSTYSDAKIYLKNFTSFNFFKKFFLFLSLKIGVLIRIIFMK